MINQSRHKDLDIIVQEREFLVPNEIRDIAVQNDTNSEITKIIIPRYFDGNDLSKYSIMLKAVSKGGRSDFLFTEKETNVLDDKIELLWTLKTPMTSYSGTIKVQLSIFGEDFKWQTNQTEFNIIKSLDGEPIIPDQLDFVEKFIIQIEEKMQEAQTILDEVKSDVDTVKGQLERAEQVAEIIQSNEQSVSQNTQKVEQIKREIEQHKNSIEESVLEVQQIKDSTEIFYDIDEEGNRVGFRRANEETFTYTPSLKGEKGDVGDIGPQGLKGEQGERGLKGDKGDAGNGWLFGMANPRPTDGRDGDLYIQTTSYDIFKKKAGAWELAGNIKGLKGDNGETGPKGEKGDQGEQGIQGIAGTDGREIQLRRHETHVQYKYAGEPDSSWRNVIALEYITGPQGERGPKGERGERGETGLQGEAGQQGEQGLKGDRGDQGLPGENGKKVELQKSSTHVQWKYEGEQQWNDLIPLYEIKGDVGPEGIAGDQGARGPKGENGNNIQLKIEAGYIKWKYDNESDESWKNLVDIEILRGPKGDRGDKGDKGEKGDAPDLSNFYTKQEVYNKSEVDQKIDEAIVGGNIDLSNYYNKQQVDEKITQIELTPGPQGPQGVRGPEGPKGEQGERGERGQTGSQGLKGDTGPQGPKGDAGENGIPVQIMRNSTHIQWKYENEQSWKFLIALNELKGEQGLQGEIGKNIELQKTATHVQWRVAGDGDWNDLIYLGELKGEPGQRGPQGQVGPQGPTGEKGDPADTSMFYTKEQVYNKSEVDEKIAGAGSGGQVNLENYYNKQQVDEKISQIELTPGPQGPKGDTGENGQVGPKGEDGKSVQLQKTSTHIQWKNTGEETWNNLIPLYEIKGDTGAEGIAGDQGPRGPQGPKGDIGEIGPAGPMGQKGDQGENGKNIELQKTQTHIQWKVEGESLWTDLVPLSELKGEKGDKGDSSTSSPEHVFITPETGFSIISNETKLYGNMMFVNVEVERTDKNYLRQGQYIQALKSPLALKPSSLSAVGSITGWFKIPSSAFAKDGSIAFTPTKDCVTAKITGWVMIQDE